MSNERSQVAGAPDFVVHLDLLRLNKVAREFPGDGWLESERPLPVGAIIPVNLEYGGELAQTTLGSWSTYFKPYQVVVLGLLIMSASLLINKAMANRPMSAAS